MTSHRDKPFAVCDKAIRRACSPEGAFWVVPAGRSSKQKQQKTEKNTPRPNETRDRQPVRRVGDGERGGRRRRRRRPRRSGCDGYQVPVAAAGGPESAWDSGEGDHTIPVPAGIAGRGSKPGSDRLRHARRRRARKNPPLPNWFSLCFVPPPTETQPCAAERGTAATITDGRSRSASPSPTTRSTEHLSGSKLAEWPG